ncbi:MAG: hypothetical protein ABI743_04295 [bacterium]
MVIFIGTFVAYYYLALKPKVEEIASLEAQKQSKINDLGNKLTEIKELKNYEVRLAVLEDQWQDNKHWFINGLTDWTRKEDVRQTQFNIFQLYIHVVDIARASGIDVDNRGYETPFQLKIDEQIKFYLDDDPYNVPNEFYFLLENIDFEPANRFKDEGDTVGVTTEGKSLFEAHNFQVQGTATYEQISHFAKYLQQRFGQEDTLIAVHCYASDGDPLINVRTPFFTNQVYSSSIQIGFTMYCTAYSIFDAPGITINTPPSLPGETDCKGSNGSSRGGGGGGGGGGMGGGGLSLGAG